MASRIIIILSLVAFVSLNAMAQTEIGGQVDPPTPNDATSLHSEQPSQNDSLRLLTDSPSPKWKNNSLPFSSAANDRITSGNVALNNDVPGQFYLWRGANLSFYGSTTQRIGLMDEAIGVASLRQDIGRFSLTGMAVADKYWLPMQHHLSTHYGFGGNVGYRLTNAVSLHAFGFYSLDNPLVGPAFSPFVNTSTFGGYADIRFSERFGSDMGVRRYINPMSGQWVTSPIVTPYVLVGEKKMKIQLPLGEIIKAAIWGDSDNPLKNRRPMPDMKNGKIPAKVAPMDQAPGRGVLKRSL